MDTVYLETTEIGNIAGRLHPDPLVAARQTITRQWWTTAGQKYRLLASELVIDECNVGDSSAAQERLSILDGVELLDTSEEVENLAAALTASGAVPVSQPRDAFHIAIAEVNGVQYLVTWNFKHIANPILQTRIESVCRDCGFEPPVICTPEQLLEAENDSDSD